MIKTTVLVTLQVEGLHRWPDARQKEPEMGYLADMHRHIFHIKCEKDVSHSDRDKEFIMMKREVLAYITGKWGYAPAQFKDMSCEMIAKDIMTEFNLRSCEVWEDLENGARVVNTEYK